MTFVPPKIRKKSRKSERPMNNSKYNFCPRPHSPLWDHVANKNCIANALISKVPHNPPQISTSRKNSVEKKENKKKMRLWQIVYMQMKGEKNKMD